METDIDGQLHQLLDEGELPHDAIRRAHWFLLFGDLYELYGLPLPSEAMMEVGEVILRGARAIRYPYSKQPVLTLSDVVRRQLRALARDGEEHAEAALYVLVQDIKARAFNHALAAVS